MPNSILADPELRLRLSDGLAQLRKRRRGLSEQALRARVPPNLAAPHQFQSRHQVAVFVVVPTGQFQQLTQMPSCRGIRCVVEQQRLDLHEVLVVATKRLRHEGPGLLEGLVGFYLVIRLRQRKTVVPGEGCLHLDVVGVDLLPKLPGFFGVLGRFTELRRVHGLAIAIEGRRELGGRIRKDGIRRADGKTDCDCP